MKWLFELETNDDPISACRLMNIFRRKGLKLEAFGMAQHSGGFSLLALVEFTESELGHVFNYLRRTEGVEGATCYRHDESAEASFILVDAEGHSALEIIKKFPESKLIFSSLGKCLLEVPPGTWPSSGVVGGLECLAFARAITTESVSPPEPVGAATERRTRARQL